MRPRSNVFAAVVVLFASARVLATWSIVIVDAESKEVAVGTVTCLNQFDLLALVPVVVVGKGGAAVQAAGDFDGIRRPIIFDGLMNGTSPQELLETLSGLGGHQDRQYGIVDVLGRKITFTGEDTFEWAGGVVGSQCTKFYAIQGNILAGDCVVPAIEAAILNTPGDIPDKLMAGMQAAREQGGDGRCSCSEFDPTGCGCPPPAFTKSGHIGGMVVARIGDTDDDVCNASGCADGDYFMRLNVPFQDDPDPDPVEQLQQQFDAWRTGLVGVVDAVHSQINLDPPSIPSDGVSETTLHIALLDWQEQPVAGPVKSVIVQHAPDSAGLSSIGDVLDKGQGNYAVTITAGNSNGIDRFRVTVDDKQPVVLMPDAVLEYCEPDDCQLDCNENDTLDACDIGDGVSGDCNGNLVPDECEIAAGQSLDCDANGVPDECQPDCNTNGVADPCDISGGTSDDIDENGVPDECHQIFFVPSGHPTIQSAIDAAMDGDTVMIADGVYTGAGNKDLDFAGKSVFVRSVNGPAKCIIDCEGGGRGFDFHNGEGREAIVDGLTITGGSADNGAAMSFDNESGPTIRGCILTENNATSLGGAIYCTDGSSPLISHCIMTGNSAGSRGGAVHCTSGGETVILNSLLAGNGGASIGGAVSTSAADLLLLHTTLANNTASNLGGALYATAQSNVVMSHCIAWGDSAPASPEFHLSSSGTTMSISYSDVQGGPGNVGGTGTLNWLEGNLDTDPVFVDAGSGDFRLSFGSPCVDSGDPKQVTAPSTDLDDHPRVMDGDGDGEVVVDMGALERTCVADLDGDAEVSITDLLSLLSEWGTDPAGPPDLNGNGDVDISDLLILLASWGPCA